MTPVVELKDVFRVYSTPEGGCNVGITARSLHEACNLLTTSVRLIHEPQRISLAADAGVSEDTRALHVGVTCA